MKNPKPKDNWMPHIPFVYNTQKKALLEKPVMERQEDFLNVIFKRRSDTSLLPISLSELSELLYYSNRIQHLGKDDYGYITTKRTAPSAGGRHPIDILVSFPTKENKTRLLNYYNPIDHSLNELVIESSIQNIFFDEVNQNLDIKNAVLLWFSIQPYKTSSKYENAESLYWRDVGALLYCIQLVSSFLELKSCPLGTLAANSFHLLFENDSLLSGGGILVGK